MRFSVLPLFAIFVGIAAACKQGDYSCGTGENANTVMLCDANGAQRAVNTCGGGTTCRLVSGRAVCA